MKKRIAALMLTAVMAVSLTACGNSADAPAAAPAEETEEAAEPAEAEESAAQEASGGVRLNVTTTFAGNDGNAQNFRDAVAAWEAETGNTVADASATDDETFQMFMDGKAAFLIDGSWKVGGIVAACQSDPEDASTLDTEKLAKFDVTYVPGQGDRKATDLIGGLSMGYYISAKAWEDPDTRAAAVSFVEYMTSDEIVPIFAQHTASALKNAPAVDETQFNPLQVKSMKMMSGTTSLTGAVQDIFNGDCRVSTFDGMPEIVTGKVDAEDAVADGLEMYQDAQE